MGNKYDDFEDNYTEKIKLEENFEVECEECGNIIEIDKDEIEFEFTDSYERSMGNELKYEGNYSINCEECSNEIIIEIEAWEYPVGAFNFGEYNISGGRYIKKPQVIYNYEFDIEEYENYEQAEDKIEKLIKTILEDNSQLKNISPFEFEDIIERIFIDKGFEVIPTKRTRDGGKDLIVKAQIMGCPIIMFVECKHYKNTIGVELVRNLHGVQESENVGKAFLITTSKFSKDCYSFTEKIKQKISLIDGEAVLKLINDYKKQKSYDWV